MLPPLAAADSGGREEKTLLLQQAVAENPEAMSIHSRCPSRPERREHRHATLHALKMTQACDIQRW
jgi:hypothetical protein